MNQEDQNIEGYSDCQLPVEDWNPSTLSILCVTIAFCWVGLAALYQTCQSIAWLWNLATGGAQ